MTTDLQSTEPGDTAPRLPPQRVDRIGKYSLQGEIGRGACGVVYRGFDPFVERDVAVKVALSDSALRGGDGERAFFVEARAAGLLQHPHIVSLYDAGVEDNLSYIVMEFVDGDTLLPLCRGKGPRASVERVIDIAFKCAKALDYAHSRGVLHRDIKPSNIMVTRQGVPKLMDFSIAEITSAPRGATPTALIGSPLYMAPEQVRRQPPGPAADLYALGAVMFQLLTGMPPFTQPDMPALLTAIRSQPAPRVRSLRSDVPEGVSDIVDRLLRKEPSERFASGQELAGALLRQFDQLRMAGAQLARRESRDSLRRLHFFSRFSESEVDEILNAATMATFAPGQKIIEEGAIDNAFYILALGSAEVRKADKLLHRLERGDCVGEFAFLGAVRRTASVVASTQVLVLKINATLLDRVSTECQLRFYQVFTQTLIYRLSVTSAKLSSLS
jgi:serine/threonine protein kinase